MSGVRLDTWKGNSIYIHTPRLRLHPLRPEEINKARWRLGPILRDLDAEILSADLWEWWQRRRVYSAKAFMMQHNPRAWLLSTTWLIIDGTENLLAGDIGFKGPPTAVHGVELGYSTRKPMRGRGIMTEAVNAMVEYAFGQREYTIDVVTALTKHSNTASQRVLQKNGFLQKPSYSPYMYWERSREKK